MNPALPDCFRDSAVPAVYGAVMKTEPTAPAPAASPLDYQAPAARRVAPPTGEAILLCTPGLLCWGWFLVLWSWSGAVPSGMLQVFWALWALAVGSALVSVVRYVFMRRASTPAVILNLTVNVAGLLFSIVGLLGFV